FHLTDARVSSYDRKGGAPDAEVQRSSNDAGGDTLVGGGHLADDAIEDVLVHDDLELLRRVIRPHGQNVQITLNFHHVVEDEREVLPVADIQLQGGARRAVEAEQAVGIVVVDRNGGLRADFHPVALVLDLALVVSVRDRGEHCGGVELLHEFATPNFRDEPSRLKVVAGRADGKNGGGGTRGGTRKASARNSHRSRP